MIIVSQEKDGIINFDNVLVIRLSIDFETNKKTIIYVDCVGDEHFGIGKYDTEERAKEVLQDISLRYEAIELCKRDHSMSDILGYTFADYTPIYEMPED